MASDFPPVVACGADVGALLSESDIWTLGQDFEIGGISIGCVLGVDMAASMRNEVGGGREGGGHVAASQRDSRSLIKELNRYLMG